MDFEKPKMPSPEEMAKKENKDLTEKLEGKVIRGTISLTNEKRQEIHDKVMKDEEEKRKEIAEKIKKEMEEKGLSFRE
jgi:hypothetical protein